MSKDKEIVAWGYAPGTWMQNNWLKYKLTREKWQEFWVAQDGRCGGCGEPLAHPLQRDMNKAGLKPQVDHRHIRLDGVEQQCRTEDVRGLLCRGCNQLLGVIQDNRVTLRGLLAYLQKHGDY